MTAIRKELIDWLRWVVEEGDTDPEGSAHQEAVKRLMELEAWRPDSVGKERFAREGCECDRLGRSDDDECIYDDPCPNHGAPS